MNNILPLANKIIFIISIIFLLNSCHKNVDYLSENDKKYLFYNQGDTIVFCNNYDTLYGYVNRKEFKIESHPNILGGDHEFETGDLWIVKLDGLSNISMNIGISNDGEMTELGYIFQSDSLINTDCYLGEISFITYLINGELVTYSDTGKYIKMDPIAPNTYELLGHDLCNYDKQYKLQINQEEKSLLIYKDTDSIFIKKYKD